MLIGSEIKEIRRLLEESRNPFFLYDDDQDGVCSYLLLKKKYNKGDSCVIKVSPELDKSYVSIVNENNPDLIVILDKPLVSKEFVSGVNVPILWIDHHPVVDIKKFDKKIYYFNPVTRTKEYVPTTYLISQVVEIQDWIALLGCIGDHYTPDFYSKMLKEYPDLLSKKDDPGYITYETRFGALVRLALFLLKGKVSDVKKNIALLSKIGNPYEILDKTTDNGKMLVKRAEKFKVEYDELLESAVKEASKDKFLVFIYPSGNNSYTGELSNEISYRFRDKFIIIGREKNDEIKMSLRCCFVNIPALLKKALIGIRGYGDGHEHAAGSAVKRDDFERFVQNLRDEVEKIA